MPNRILKETICTSENLTSLGWGEQIFFLRLLVQCDDFGRFDARIPLMRASCFPFELDRVSEQQIGDWLQSLVRADLLWLYVVSGKPYLQMTTWGKHQRKRAQFSKYPNPPAVVDICTQPLSLDNKGTQPLSDVARESRVEESRVEESRNRESSGAKVAPPVVQPSLKHVIDHETTSEPELLREIMHAFQRGTGEEETQAIPYGSARSALRQLLDDKRAPPDVEGCTRYLKAGWWQDKCLSISKVADSIGQWITQGRPRDAPTVGKVIGRVSKWSEDELKAARAAEALDPTPWARPPD